MIKVYFWVFSPLSRLKKGKICEDFNEKSLATQTGVCGYSLESFKFCIFQLLAQIIEKIISKRELSTRILKLHKDEQRKEGWGGRGNVNPLNIIYKKILPIYDMIKSLNEISPIWNQKLLRNRKVETEKAVKIFGWSPQNYIFVFI